MKSLILRLNVYWDEKKEKYFYIGSSSEHYLSAPESRILELQSFENQFLKYKFKKKIKLVMYIYVSGWLSK